MSIPRLIMLTRLEALPLALTGGHPGTQRDKTIASRRHLPIWPAFAPPLLNALRVVLQRAPQMRITRVQLLLGRGSPRTLQRPRPVPRPSNSVAAVMPAGADAAARARPRRSTSPSNSRRRVRVPASFSAPRVAQKVLASRRRRQVIAPTMVHIGRCADPAPLSGDVIQLVVLSRQIEPRRPPPPHGHPSLGILMFGIAVAMSPQRWFPRPAMPQIFATTVMTFGLSWMIA